MKKKNKVLLILLIIFIVLFILGILNINLSKKSEKLVECTYNSKGDYEQFSYELSKHDYETIAAGSIGVFEQNASDFEWDYDINHIHTLSWGFGAYSYINDSCDIYCSDGKHYAGYAGRHIRLKWKLDIKSGKYKVVEAYEYVTPGIINSFFDMIS